MLPFSTHTPLHPVHFKPGQHPPSKVMPHSCPFELHIGFFSANKKCPSKISGTNVWVNSFWNSIYFCHYCQLHWTKEIGTFCERVQFIVIGIPYVVRKVSSIFRIICVVSVVGGIFRIVCVVRVVGGIFWIPCVVRIICGIFRAPCVVNQVSRTFFVLS